VLALKIGMSLLNALMPSTADGQATAESFPPPPDFDFSQPIGSFTQLGEWALGMGWPLVVGVFTLALSLGMTGYVLTRLGWNLWVRWEVIQRRKRRS
jgi:hypothetical protein